MPRNFVLVLAAVSLGLGLPAPAQKFIPKTIQFKGDPEYSTEELMAASGLKKGETLSYADMNDTSKRLMATGMFASMMFKFDGQDLVFQFTPGEQLVPIYLDNLPISPGAELDARLHQRLPLYHGKVPSEGGMLNDVREALEAMLVAQGIKTTLVVMPAPDEKTHQLKAMHFSITSPAVQVSVKQIEGASGEFQNELHAVTVGATKIPFDTENSESNIEHAFSSFYQDRGYAAVKVHASPTGNPEVSSDAIVVPYSVKIEEGRIYKVGAVRLAGNSLVTQAEVAKVLAPVPNQVTGTRLRSLWSFIADRYHSKGYLDCKITPTPQFDETDATVNYDVAIDPGPVYHLAFVKFENVSDDLRTLLMRNWQMLPGDPFDQTYVNNFIVAAQQKDPTLRRTMANVTTSFKATADPLTHDVNVVIRLDKQ